MVQWQLMLEDTLSWKAYTMTSLYVIFYFHWFDCLYHILSHVGTFNPFSFTTSILFLKISALGVGLNISCFAAQQHLSLRSIKYGDCHGPKHVRKSSCSSYEIEVFYALYLFLDFFFFFNLLFSFSPLPKKCSCEAIIGKRKTL